MWVNGEEYGAVSLFKIAKGLDKGPVVGYRVGLPLFDGSRESTDQQTIDKSYRDVVVPAGAQLFAKFLYFKGVGGSFIGEIPQDEVSSKNLFLPG